jgi:uncharacterized RDD family membrane protein YckC
MLARTGRQVRVYQPHETARMLELEGMELASFTSRACALGIDFLVAAVLFMSAGMGLGAIATHLGVKGNVHIELNFFENWYSIVYLVLFFGLSVYIGNGKTLGKRLFHIRVVSLVHRRMSLWHSVERALGYGASTLELGFGFLQYFIHPNRRTVHDRIAETIVVRDTATPPRSADRDVYAPAVG